MKKDTPKTNKEKITVTLSPRIIQKLDQWCEGMRMKSRSAAIEKVMEAWIELDERQRLEKETEAYYLSMSDQEKKEDKAWAKLSSLQAIYRF